LALDLEEEFRPIIVDTLVLALVNAGMIRASDFQQGSEPARPVLLSEPARRLFLRKYAERLEISVQVPSSGESTSYRRLLELQVRALAARWTAASLSFLHGAVAEQVTGVRADHLRHYRR